MVDALTMFVVLATVPFASPCGADSLAVARACRANNACVEAALERCQPFWMYPRGRSWMIAPRNPEPPAPEVGPPRA